jgi:hypothetical protein
LSRHPHQIPAPAVVTKTRPASPANVTPRTSRVISLIGNRPVIQIGRHQVAQYGTDWLANALRRAASAADHQDFPFLDEIRDGVFHYLETKCPLRLLPAAELVDRVRRMLVQIGCRPIAEQLTPFAPPVVISLIEVARQAGNGFELLFFEALRAEICELRKNGAAAIHFHGHEQAILELTGAAKWNHRCATLLEELRQFLTRQLEATPPAQAAQKGLSLPKSP